MQQLIFLFFLPIFADSAEPLKSAELRLGATSATVTLETRQDGAALNISVKDQKPQLEAALGQEFIPIEHKGKESYIAVTDLEGDGVEEFFVRVGIPPQAGALWLFKWDQKRFAPVPHSGEDFIHVDYAAPVKLDAKNNLEIHLVRTNRGKRSVVKESLNWKGGAYAK